LKLRIERSTPASLAEVARWHYEPPYDFYDDDGKPVARAHLGAQRIVLDVAALNERALRVYKRAGFRRTGRHKEACGSRGEVEFVDMELVR
jgi:hypothetical protein